MLLSSRGGATVSADAAYMAPELIREEHVTEVCARICDMCKCVCIYWWNLMRVIFLVICFVR